MNEQRAVIQQMVDALDHADELLGGNDTLVMNGAAAGRWLLEQPAVQEPVATLFGSLPVYDTTPPAAQKPWVGLTDEEIHETEGYEETREMYRFALAIEAKLKEKNHDQ